MFCILVDKEFLVYVVEDINVEYVKFFFDVVNVYKLFFLYEKGKEM